MSEIDCSPACDEEAHHFDIAREAGVVERGRERSVPPQLRMFMRMMLQPARHSLFALPTTYCEFDEPSRPCTMMAVGRVARTSSGCQWQWQRTWLEIWSPSRARPRPVALLGRGSDGWAGKIVAEDGLQVAVAKETPGLKLIGFQLAARSIDLGILACHQRPLAARREKAAALSAPVGSSSCLK
jgi:hypothetical protein